MVEEEMPAAVGIAAGDVVAYIGMSDVRIISAESWSGIDIDGDDRIWNDDNRKEIPAADFSAAELEWLGREEDFAIRAPSPVVVADLEITPDPAQHYE